MSPYSKILFFSFLNILFWSRLSAQNDSVLTLKIDTVIHTGIYVSYYSFEVKNPIYVSYKLYKGGGNCNRKKLRFTNEKDPRFSSNKDYTKSGLDRGHLANAEDFAGNCDHLKLTFKFYNCLPQYHNLNGGIWSKYERAIRELSQNDSLLIICGGIYYKGETITDKQVAIPRYCFKLAKSLTTHQLVYCLLFTNKKEQNEVISTLSLEELKEKLSCEIIF